MKLLIVDDSEAMRRLIKKVLPSGNETFECGNGAEALTAFVTHQPDWVLMDIEMEGMDGLTAARNIRANSPAARIIFVTGHSEVRFREAAQALPAQGYVLKENLDQINLIVSQPSPG